MQPPKICFISTYILTLNNCDTPSYYQFVHTQTPKHCTIIGIKTGLQGYWVGYDTRSISLAILY